MISEMDLLNLFGPGADSVRAKPKPAPVDTTQLKQQIDTDRDSMHHFALSDPKIYSDISGDWLQKVRLLSAARAGKVPAKAGR